MPEEAAETMTPKRKGVAPRRMRLARRALTPLKEAYFVGVGALDWMMEQAIAIEQHLSERGHRRNENLSRMASKVGAAVGEKTRAMSMRGRQRMEDLGAKVEERMRKVRMRPEMPEAEPA